MNDIVTFKDEQLELEVNISPEEDTVWLSLDQLSDLFDKNKSTISRHIKNIFSEGELDSQVVVAKFATTTQHGAIAGKTQSHITSFYNLDVIISVGYRVKSPRGVLFRKWATNVLRQYFPIKTKKPPFYAVSRVFNMVGAARFELTASCTRISQSTFSPNLTSFIKVPKPSIKPRFIDVSLII